MTESVIVKYSDVDISYNERDDRWEFELRGRSRSADTLVKAKEAIDKPPADKAEAKTFQRIKAYLQSGYSSTSTEFEVVEVTSVAENSYGSGDYFWIVDKGKREKKSGSSLFLISPENDAAISELTSIQKELDDCHKRLRVVISKMKKVQP